MSIKNNPFFTRTKKIKNTRCTPSKPSWSYVGLNFRALLCGRIRFPKPKEFTLQSLFD